MRGKKNHKIASFWYLLKSNHIAKGPFVFGLIGTALFTAASLSIPLLTKILVNGFTFDTKHIALLIMLGFIIIVQAVINALSNYMLSKVGENIVFNIREKMWDKLISMPVSYYDKNHSGELVSRVVNDTNTINDLVSGNLSEFIRGLLTIIGTIIVLFILDWKMTILMIITFPLATIVMVPLGKKISQISRRMQDETANLTETIQQTLSEIRLMKHSTAEGYEKRKGKASMLELFLYSLKHYKLTSIIGPTSYTMMILVAITIVGYGGLRVTNGDMSTGTLVAFILYIFIINDPILSFSTTFGEFSKAQGATERIVNILGQSGEKYNGIRKSVANEPIHLKDVSFSFNNSNLILDNINLYVNPGDVIALSGPSGAGKSTLLALLERFYEPNTGEIRIGNIPINSLSLESWRGQIGYVSQESSMISGTIRNNLTYGLDNEKQIGDSKLWEVAKLAYIDTFIDELPNKMETHVGERGVKLSGGQRQRINIARAFLRDPKILMLDEATASLDSQSEEYIQEALWALMKGRTAFIIAHRLSTIVDADKIVFMEKGKITGMGTHKELLETHSLYKDFSKNQLKTS